MILGNTDPSHRRVERSAARMWLRRGLLAALVLGVGVAVPWQSAEADGGPEIVRIPLADGFDFPVGKPDAEGYYMSRGFWANRHLGEDWNGVGGGNTDLGDPVYSIGSGVVSLAGDMRGAWGKTVIVRHAYRERSTGRVHEIDSFYTHLDQIKVERGQLVGRGEQVGTIGTNRGMYTAHLHFEMRKNIRIGMARIPHARDHTNYFVPSDFINAHRQLRRERGTVPVDINTY